MLESPEQPMLHCDDEIDKDAPLLNSFPQWHSFEYSTPAYLNPWLAQKEAHLEGVMSLEAVAAPFKARPFCPSAIQTVEAGAHPDGRDAALAVRSADRLAILEGMAKMVKASGPPQILVGEPPHAMLPCDEVFVRDAPFTRAYPQ